MKRRDFLKTATIVTAAVGGLVRGVPELAAITDPKTGQERKTWGDLEPGDGLTVEWDGRTFHARVTTVTRHSFGGGSITASALTPETDDLLRAAGFVPSMPRSVLSEFTFEWR